MEFLGRNMKSSICQHMEQFSRQAYLVAIKPTGQPNHELLIDCPSRTCWVLAEMGHASCPLSYVHTVGILTCIWLCAYPYPNNALRHIHSHTICMPMDSLSQTSGIHIQPHVYVHIRQNAHISPMAMPHVLTLSHILHTQPHMHIFIPMYTLPPVHDLRHKRHIEKCCPDSGTGSKWYKTGVGYQQPWDNFPDIKYSEHNAVFSIQCDFQSLSSIAMYQTLPCAPP